MRVINIINKIRVEIREKTNLKFGKSRRNKLHNTNFTIISNNCWGGQVYRYFQLSYSSPTVGCYFFADEYIRFISNLKKYIDTELTFIDYKESKYKDKLEARHQEKYPIGVLDDVEIVFLHYKTREEAYEKWNRRKARIYWDNIIYKMSEMNFCSLQNIIDFEKLTFKGTKFIFVTKDYGINSQVIFAEDCLGSGNIPDDTNLFRKYIDLVGLLNGQNFKLKQEKAIKKIKYMSENRN